MKQLKLVQFAVMATFLFWGVVAVVGSFSNLYHIITAVGCFAVVLAAYTSKW